ncbi:hypothetical protein [Pseudomonas sp. N040]|uniref:hypothetical protein n=1 Tax=Pseudomonas sp. N040 TaxID=2785325 RepID=UPI0018A276F1|nr:hypothetical protein [Pseudomonas sp. N040]MBF7731118.1 hypothetical protein [Pseudomonas sp. N040]MBW7014761.1 hypothetical protein [Pseudomonas sp. N040]
MSVINLRQEIKRRAADRNHTEILVAMGYEHPSEQAIARLKWVMGSPTLGLEKGPTDYQYTREQFVLKLCQVLEIPEDGSLKAVKDASEYWSNEAWAFRPQLHAITGLKREGRSAMTMGHLLNQCRVDLPDGIWHQPLDVQVEMAKATVRKNMQETAGDFGPSGQVERYRFVYEKDKSLELSLEGEIIGGVIPCQETNK